MTGSRSDCNTISGVSYITAVYYNAYGASDNKTACCFLFCKGANNILGNSVVITVIVSVPFIVVPMISEQMESHCLASPFIRGRSLLRLLPPEAITTAGILGSVSYSTVSQTVQVRRCNPFCSVVGSTTTFHLPNL